MRSSDWSSDVCSSDLAGAVAGLAEEAKAQNIGIVGHNVKAVGLARQLAAGQAMVAHVEEFFYGFFPEPSEADPHAPPDDARIADAIALVKAHGHFVTSDLLKIGRAHV